LFGCEIGSFPFKYLGIPIHFRKLKNGEWKPIEDRFERELATWLGKLLSYGDRLVLINLVLTSLPMLMFFFEIPKGFRKRHDFFRSRFFFGKVMKTNVSIGLLSGILYEDQKNKGAWC
jgi:hypothetical protein